MLKQLLKRMIIIYQKEHMLNVILKELDKAHRYKNKTLKYFDKHKRQFNKAKTLMNRYTEIYLTGGEDK